MIENADWSVWFFFPVLELDLPAEESIVWNNNQQMLNVKTVLRTSLEVVEGGGLSELATLSAPHMGMGQKGVKRGVRKVRGGFWEGIGKLSSYLKYVGSI